VSRPKIVVLGAGGTGGNFGGRLAESGADVTFLVRDGRRKSLSEQGLRIESRFGDAQIEVKTAVAAEVAPVYDAAILTCKDPTAGPKRPKERITGRLHPPRETYCAQDRDAWHGQGRSGGGVGSLRGIGRI
jgi:Ketopantoate reductase PanE/ApbA